MKIGIRNIALGSIAALAIAGGTLQSCRPREKVVFEEVIDRYPAGGDKLIIHTKEAVDSCSENNEKLKSNSEKAVDSISANKEKQKTNFEKLLDRYPKGIKSLKIDFWKPGSSYDVTFLIIHLDYFFNTLNSREWMSKLSTDGLTDDEVIEASNQIACACRINEVVDSTNFVNNATVDNYNKYVQSQKYMKTAQKLQNDCKKNKETHIRDKARQDSLAKVHEAKIKAYAEELKNKSKK